MSQAITPELRSWILDQVGAGHTPDAVLQAMVTAGWQEDVALSALETTLAEHLAAHGVPVESDGPAAAHGFGHATVPATHSAQAPTEPPLGGQPADRGRSAPATAEPEPAGLTGAAQRWAQRLSRQGEGGLESDGARVHAVSGGAATGQPRATRAAQPMPDPELGNSPRVIDLGDRQVGVVVSMARPRVVVFSGFLSDGECDALVAAARPRMARSLTVETQTGGEAINADRTSNGMFFRRAESELVARIETRIARLLHWPLENGEGLQVLHYGPGAEYKPHYDYFDPAQPGTIPILKRGGQRLATLVMYLNNPERGGGTTFPDVGLEVHPQRGNAVFFAYDSPSPSTQTLHGGAPVLAGEKWVATKWLREAEFI